MTTFATPTSARSTQSTSTHPVGRSTTPSPRDRPGGARGSMVVRAGVAGAGVALGGLVVLMAVALTGWFLTDNGVHGSTRDALRVGADAWLLAHGSHLSLGGVDYTVVPLGLTLLLVAAVYRAGRWAASAAGLEQEHDGSREIALGAVVLGSGYVVVAVVSAVLAGTPDASGNLALTLLGALVIGLGGGTAGLLSGADRWRLVGDRLPDWVWPVVRAALTVLVGLLSVATVLVVVSFALHLGAASALVSELGLAPVDTVLLAVLGVVLLPNAALLGAAYVVGPGFAVGAGTTVSPTVVVLGPLPAFPLLAALPGEGPVPWFATATMALPPLVAALAVALVQRRHPVRAWDVAALRGIGAGVLAGVLTGLLGTLGGGALGDGRMADVGPSAAPVLAAACLSMGLGGLVGALVTTFFQRRRPPAETEEAETSMVVPAQPGERPRVLVPSRPDEPTVRLGDDGRDRAGFGARELRARFVQQTTDHPVTPAPDSAPDPDAEDTVQVPTD